MCVYRWPLRSINNIIETRGVQTEGVQLRGEKVASSSETDVKSRKSGFN